METAQDESKREVDKQMEESTDADVADPRQLLELLLKKTEEMERRLERILRSAAGAFECSVDNDA